MSRNKMKHSEKLAFKYKFLREKIIESYRKGCKALNIIKIIFAVLFIVFTVVITALAQKSDDKTVWIMWWVVVILFEVTIFTITDYFKNMIKEKVIPYLLDDDQLEFGKISLFDEYDEDEDEEEEDDEE